MLEFFFGKTKPASSSLDSQVIDLNKYEGSSKQRPIVHLPTLAEELIQALQKHLNINSLDNELVKKMPKADLHVHAEAGFLMDMQLARKLAERNKVEFPEYLIDPESDLWMYRGLEDFCQFLKDFRAISNLIQTPQDVEDITYAFYKYCYENNVIFALPGISWIQCKDKMGFPEFIQAYNNALLNGMREFGEVSILRLRYYMERQVTEEENEEIWQNLRALPNRLITTIGLAGDELNHPFGKFIPFYEKVREHRAIAGNQPYFLTAHMEKYSDSQTILEATRLLDWIAHGRNAADSEDCLNAMIAKGMRFEICPKSDIAVYEEIPDLDQHIQLKKLLAAQVVTLSSDDPAFFGGVTGVYQDVLNAKLVDYSQLLQCTVNGLMPAQPASLEEFNANQPKFFQEQQRIAMTGFLKIQFFQYYWLMLPSLVNLPAETAQKLFQIDLKTSEKQIVEYLSEVIDPVITDALSGMLQCKCKIRTNTQAILEETKQMHSEFYERCNQDDTMNLAFSLTSTLNCLSGML